MTAEATAETGMIAMAPAVHLAGDAANPVTIVEAPRGWPRMNVRELWARREVLYFLAWRDLRIRYKQTAVGMFWVVLQPVLMMLIYTVFFGKLASIKSEGHPYHLFVLAGLVPWQYFNHSLSESSQSLISFNHLVTRIFFPRIIVPLAPVIAGLVDLAIATVLLVVMMLLWGERPGIEVLAAPVFFLLLVLYALGLGLWLAATNTRFRDVRYALPFFLQVLFYTSPIVYPTSLLHGFWKEVYRLNPMVQVVDGLRWSLLGMHAPGWTLAYSFAGAIVLLATGWLYFRKSEPGFADIV